MNDQLFVKKNTSISSFFRFLALGTELLDFGHLLPDQSVFGIVRSSLLKIVRRLLKFCTADVGKTTTKPFIQLISHLY